MISRKFMTGFLAVIIAVGLSSSSFAKDLYAFDLRKQKPDLFKVYRAIVPKSLARLEWFAKLEGVSVPLKTQSVGGAEFLLGSSCQPHNCNMSYVNFMISTDGKRAIAMFVDDTKINGAILFSGDPTNQEKINLLDQQSFR